MVALVAKADILGELGEREQREATIEAARAVSDALGGTFFRPSILAHVAAIALTRGDGPAAERANAEAFSAAGSDWFQALWPTHTSIVAAEDLGDADRLLTNADRIARIQGEASTVWSVSERYARALAHLLRDEHAEALADADAGVELAVDFGDRASRWRIERVAWHALEGLGRSEEASERRAAAAAILHDQLGTVPDELRAGFLARPLVADVLAP
jgi:hypothetical protein